MTTEILAPAAAAPAIAMSGGREIVLPPVIVDAGPSAVARFLEFFAGRITAYLSNGGTLEHAQQIAGHASPKTTKLYDRTADTLTVDEIERIVI